MQTDKRKRMKQVVYDELAEALAHVPCTGWPWFRPLCVQYGWARRLKQLGVHVCRAAAQLSACRLSNGVLGCIYTQLVQQRAIKGAQNRRLVPMLEARQGRPPGVKPAPENCNWSPVHRQIPPWRRLCGLVP